MVEPGDTASTVIQFGPPKYQTTIPKPARNKLNMSNIGEDDRIVVECDLTVLRIEESDHGGDE